MELPFRIAPNIQSNACAGLKVPGVMPDMLHPDDERGEGAGSRPAGFSFVRTENETPCRVRVALTGRD
jgi:hypothetical protein